MNKTFSQHEPNNKLPVIYYLLMVAVLFFMLFCTSCKSKALQNTQIIEKENTIKNDSVTTILNNQDKTTKIETNKEILDSLFVPVSEIKTNKLECDSLVNVEVQKALKKLTTKKISGSNEYGLYYDEINKKLVFYVKVGETKNTTFEDVTIKDKSSKVNKSTDKKESDKQVKQVFIKYIPKWIQVLACIGFLFIAYIVVRLVIFITKLYQKIKPV